MNRIRVTSFVLIALCAASSWASQITTELVDSAHRTATVSAGMEHSLAQVADFEICLDELPTFNEELGDPANDTFDIDVAGLGIPTTFFVTALAWDVNLESIGASWASEATFAFTTDLSGPVFLTPGAGDDIPVPPTNYSGSASLGGTIPLLFSSDGIISIELFETFDDAPGPDTNLLADSSVSFLLTDPFGIDHTVTVKWVPEPAGIGMALLALLGVVAVSRRNR